MNTDFSRLDPDAQYLLVLPYHNTKGDPMIVDIGHTDAERLVKHSTHGADWVAPRIFVLRPIVPASAKIPTVEFELI